MEARVVKKPAQTGAERIAKYRAKRKAENMEYQASENKRIEQARKQKVSAMTAQEKKTYRMSVAERKRKSREAKKVKELEKAKPTVRIIYKSPQAMGKALKKAEKFLPSSPRKRAAVVSGLAKRVGLKLEKSMTESLAVKVNYGLSEEVKNAVSEFYFRQDVVYTMPGLHDKIVVWDSVGKKETLRKYFLTMFLREAHAIFKAMHPDFNIGLSAFAALRPPNVLLLKNSPKDQCKCKIHENFILKLRGIGCTYDVGFWDKVLCNSEDNSACWRGVCQDCKNGIKFEMHDIESSKPTQWQEWQVPKENRIMRKITLTATAEELFGLILGELPSVLEHVRIKRVQAEAFQEDIKDQNKRVLQIDFAMAYACEYQDEVQSALWSRSSVQLFTAAVFCESTCESYLVCSDTQEKNKDTIFVFLCKLYEEIMLVKPSAALEEVIFSDGPSSEFKNKYMMEMLRVLGEKYNKTFTWKYFATSHGKGVVDGIGGRAKHLVRQKVMSKSPSAPVVQCSTDFAAVARDSMPNTKVMHISQEEITNIIEVAKPWEHVIPVPGIQKIHVAEYNNGTGLLKLWNSAKSSDFTETKLKDVDRQLSGGVGTNNVEELPNVGQWCTVLYEGEQYPGEVICKLANSVEVSVMIPSGPNTWKWPSRPDILAYNSSDIVKIIEAPIVCGSRGQFKFSNV